MLLTKEYTRITSSDNFLYGWITPEGKFISAGLEGSHAEILADHGIYNLDEAVIIGWCRLVQSANGKHVSCSLHYSKFNEIKRILEKLINEHVETVEFHFYNNNGYTPREKIMYVVDGQIE